MLKKLFSKILGKTGGAIADELLKRELDKRTGGAASKIEDVVEGVKKRRDRP